MQIPGRVSLCGTVTRLSQSMITSNFQMLSVPSRWAWWPPPAPSTPAASCWSVSPPRWAPSGAAGRPGGVKSACWHEGAQLLHHLLWKNLQLGEGVFSCYLTRRYGCWRWILYNVLYSSVVLDPTTFLVKSLSSIVWPEQTHSQINNVVSTTGCKACRHRRQWPNHDFGILGRPRVQIKEVKLPQSSI